MKKKLPLWMMSIAASLILSTGLLAQEKTEVTVKIKKDGKVVTDTTYLFDDMDEARHALEMMDLISGDEKHMEHIHYNITSAHGESGQSKAMVFISEDGETTEITEFSGDSNVWVTEEEGDGEHVKVMKYMIDEDGDDEVKVKVIVITKDGDEDCDHEEDVEVKVVKKKVKKEKE